MNLHITVEEKMAKDFLVQNLVGKDFGSCWDCDAYGQFRKFLESYGIDTRDFSWQKNRYDKQTLFITYKREEIGYIEVKKQKGKSRHTWLGSHYYDWNFKDVNVMFYAGDLNKSIESAEARIAERNSRNKETEEIALEVYSNLIKKYDTAKALEIINYIRDHRYTLQDKIIHEED